MGDEGCCGCCPSGAGSGREGPREIWRRRWRGLVNASVFARLRRNVDARTFQTIVRLYAHEDVVQELYDDYERDPVRFRSYVLQLSNFLVRGHYDNAAALELFLLGKSESSMVFGHRMLWFLRAFAPGCSYRSDVCAAIGGGGLLGDVAPLERAVEVQGALAARRLLEQGPVVGNELRFDDDRVPEDAAAELGHRVEAAAAAARAGAHQAFVLASEAFSRATALVRRGSGMDAEELSHVRLEEVEAEGDGGRRRGFGGGAVEERKSGEEEVEDVETGASGGVELEKVAVEKVAEKKRDRSVSSHWVGGPSHARGGGIGPSPAELACFLEEHEFCEELCRISRDLSEVAVGDRLGRLRAELESVAARFLPARQGVIYVPVGNPHNSVVALHPEHSFCFRTKERVPYLAVLEVVDYATPEGVALVPRARRDLSGDEATAESDSDGNKGIDPREHSRRKRRRHRRGDGGAAAAGMKGMGGGASLVSASKSSTDNPLAVVGNQRRRLSSEEGQDEQQVALHTPLLEEEGGRDRSSSLGELGSADEELQGRPRGARSLDLSLDLEKGEASKTNTKETLGQWSSSSKRKSRRHHHRAHPPPPISPQARPLSISTKTPDQSHRPPIPPPGATPDSPWRPRRHTEDDDELEAELARTLARLHGVGKAADDLEEQTQGAAGAIDVSTTSTSTSTGKRALIHDTAKETDAIRIPGEAVVFPEPWAAKEMAVRATSAFGHLPGWRLVPVIVKAKDDLRQEQFVATLIRTFGSIWRAANVPVWLRPYDILATSRDSGLIEAIPDTISIDALKRNDPGFTTLRQFFVRHFGGGDPHSRGFLDARRNFIASVAGYSIVSYLLNLKDRHNANILLDRNGHVAHIDFGFLLSNSPGGNLGFESAIKLTADDIELLRSGTGARADNLDTFRNLCVKAFLEARKQRDRIILQVEMMLDGNEDLPCFQAGKAAVISALRARFHPDASPRECYAIVNALIDEAAHSFRTALYDAYQRWSMGIL